MNMAINYLLRKKGKEPIIQSSETPLTGFSTPGN